MIDMTGGAGERAEDRAADDFIIAAGRLVKLGL